MCVHTIGKYKGILVSARLALYCLHVICANLTSVPFAAAMAQVRDIQSQKDSRVPFSVFAVLALCVAISDLQRCKFVGGDLKYRARDKLGGFRRLSSVQNQKNDPSLFRLQE